MSSDEVVIHLRNHRILRELGDISIGMLDSSYRPAKPTLLSTVGYGHSAGIKSVLRQNDIPFTVVNNRRIDHIRNSFPGLLLTGLLDSERLIKARFGDGPYV